MEQPIVQATVMVLKYNMPSGQWEELGSQKGTCNITIYKSTTNEYRFVSWKESNQEIVLNSYLFPTMSYNETTPTFHQWYDESKIAYGLNFTDPNEAKKFGIAVISALEILNGTKSIIAPVMSGNIPAKKNEKSPGYRSAKKKISIDRPQINSTVSPYATTGINQSSTPVVPANKPSVAGSAAPPPPGPPPAAPSPPGPPPSGPPPPGKAPLAPSNKKPQTNSFANELLAASMKSASVNATGEKTSTESSVSSEITATTNSQKPTPTSSAAPQMDFLSELKFRSSKRTDGTNQNKKVDFDSKTTTTVTPTSSVVNNATKNPINQSNKLSSSNSDATIPSYVTSADLEKFRADLMQNILSNMDKMKNEIISTIISKLP